ncbi:MULTISPECIES: hypothetical protein [Paenibacillus]|uniref:Uncharacterized protein n=1 Tax=Paenibacillus radicis (ex Xue et al. 2023) TaxID=2972489 RepID=A0ABT1YTS7_9BACL|nr:hypothetical protein [Paenibacillus radicis (ex Xue et al. 2023)]MCR8636589.1 hypothetical protein [Paenibacillus radicis (ex Xue et al. 2023)]
MAVQFKNGSTRKRRDWRRITVFILCGLLTGILFWIFVLWSSLKTG